MEQYQVITLRISTAKRPWVAGNPQRLVYRVVLASGKEISLRELAARMEISHSTLYEEIVIGGQLSVGSHTTAFVEAIARAKRKNRMLAKTVKCQHCNGRGRVPKPSASEVAAKKAHIDALNNFGEESADSAGIT